VTSEVVGSASSEVDRAYSDHSLAELYDLLNPWDPISGLTRRAGAREKSWRLMTATLDGVTNKKVE